MSLTVCSTDVESVTSHVNACACPPCRADLGDEVVERFGVARQREYRRAPFGDRDRRGPADTAGRAGDDHVLADQRPGRIVATGPIGVQMLGPVAPQLRRIRRELGHRYPGAAQGFCGVGRREGGRQVDDVEDLAGYAELGGGHVAQHLGAAGDAKERRRGRTAAVIREAAAARPPRRLRGRCRAAQWFSAR